MQRWICLWKVYGNDIGLVMKAKGFVLFLDGWAWLLFGWKVLNGNSFKGMKLQAIRSSFGWKDRYNVGF